MCLISKVELSYQDFVILVGPGSGCDTILNFPLKCLLLYKKNEKILGGSNSGYPGGSPN